MRVFFIISLLAFYSAEKANAQVDHEMWLSGGVKYSLTKKLDLSGELNLRMEPVILNTFFTEFTGKYEVTKWFKPSIDYRIVSERNKFNNYHMSQRVNLNANFGTNYKRFELGFRARAQTTLTRVRSSESSFSDLAPGIRLKPEILYDINNSYISPVVSSEFFFKNDNGIIMNKVRIAAGVDFEMLGPFNVSLKYMYGFSLISPKYEHIIAFSFTRKYKSSASKKQDNKKKKK